MMEELLLHPLEYQWELLYKLPEIATTTGLSSKDWINEFKILHPKIDTVEMFWRVYNNIPRIYETKIGTMYSFFRKGLKPCWESESNKNGFRYMINISTKNVQQIHELELAVFLFVIGNETRYHELINGCVLSTKQRYHRISLWVRSQKDNEESKSLIRIFEEKIELDEYRQNSQNRIVIHCLENNQTAAVTTTTKQYAKRNYRSKKKVNTYRKKRTR